MKKILLVISTACISLSAFANPNNINNPAPAFQAPAYPQNRVPQAPNRAPGFNRSGSNWNMPNMNMGNNRNGNGFNNGSNWNMPNMNMGNNRNGSGFNNGFSNGSNWNMPSMNWGSNRNGSNMNMPNMNWGNNNGNRGSNWNMPSFNSGSNNPPGYWNPNQNYNTYVQPNRARPNIAQPRMPVAPQPQINKLKGQVPRAKTPAAQMKIAPQAPKRQMNNSIPKPSDVKGVILAPVNKAKAATGNSTK